MRDEFPLPVYEAESAETLRSFWFTALGNTWRDVCCVLASSLLTQASASTVLPNFASTFAKAVALGQPLLLDASSARSESAASSPDKLLFSMMRLFVLGTRSRTGYYDRMEKLADRLAPSAVAEGVSGRIYMGNGSDLERLRDGYLLMLVAQVRTEWHPVNHLETHIRSWKEKDAARRELERLLEACIKRLDSSDFNTRFAALWPDLAPEGTLSFADGRELAKAGLVELASRLQEVRRTDLHNLTVSPKELRRLGDYAAEALSEFERQVPFPLLSKVEFAGEEQVNDLATKSVQISGWDKGSLTDPPQSQQVGNEDRYISGLVRQRITQAVLKDFLDAVNLETRSVSALPDFQQVVREFGDAQVAQGKTPLLLVSSRAEPYWLVEMARAPSSEEDEPLSLRLVPSYRETPGYVGHLGETGIFEAPVRAGVCYLCTTDSGGSLRFGGTRGEPIQVSAEVEPAGDTCTLTFRWQQELKTPDAASAIRLKYSTDGSRKSRQSR